MKRARIGGLTVALAVGVLICLAVGAGVLALRTVGVAAEQANLSATALTVRVLDPVTPEGIEAAVAVMRRSPGVLSATPLDGSRAARILEKWSGAPVDPDSLPAAYLIQVRLKPDALRDTAKLTLSRNLGVVGVEHEIFDSGPIVDQAGRAVQIAAWGASAAVLLLAFAVILVARAGALARPEMALLVADLGGKKPEVLAQYGRAGAELGFVGGAIAVFVASALGFGLLWFLDPQQGVRAVTNQLGSLELLLVLAGPLAAAGLCALGARAGAGRVFAAAERLG